MTLKAVLFDMDGVAIDSERHWKRVEAAFLEGKLRPGATLDLSRIVGLSVDGLHAFLSTECGLAMTLAEFRALYRQMAEIIYTEQVTLMDGFLPLLDGCRGSGAAAALASSSPHEWIGKVLDRFHLRDRFDVVVSSDDVGGVGKPAPDVYRETVRRLDARPGSCVAIEDSRNGILSAKAAGVLCVGLRNGFNDEQDLGPADLVVDSLTRLDFARLSALTS